MLGRGTTSGAGISLRILSGNMDEIIAIIKSVRKFEFEG